MQILKEKIDEHYRINMILDNLPVTTYDLLEEASWPTHASLYHTEDACTAIDMHACMQVSALCLGEHMRPGLCVCRCILGPAPVAHPSFEGTSY